MKIDTEIYGTTANGWIIRKAPTMTKRAQYAFVIQRKFQTSIIERAKDHWRAMREFDLDLLPPTENRNFCLWTIKGKEIQKFDSLTEALEALGLSKIDTTEAIQIYAKAQS